MNMYVLLSIIFSVLALSLSSILLLWKFLRGQIMLFKEMNQTNLSLIQSYQNLMNKSLTLLSTKDPLSYQQVQAMDQSQSLSSEQPLHWDDESEYDRWVAETKQELSQQNDDGIDDYAEPKLRSAGDYV